MKIIQIILVPLTGHSMNHSKISILLFRTIYAIQKTSHFSSSAITHVIHLKRRYYLYHKNLAKKVKHDILLREGSPFFFSFTVCPCLKCKINPETLAILNVETPSLNKEHSTPTAKSATSLFYRRMLS